MCISTAWIIAGRQSSGNRHSDPFMITDVIEGGETFDLGTFTVAS
jgi:hypothetical protein